MALTRLFVHDTFYDATDNFTYTPGMRLTLDNTTQSARITRLQNSGVVSTDETIDPAGVAITGGNIDGTVIGATTAAAGTFTTITVDTTTLVTDAANNRVGVGTATPLTDLHVNGLAIADAGSGNGFGFERSSVAYSVLALGAVSSDVLSLINPLGNRLALGTSGVEHLGIDVSGNVGIGTTAPNRLLHILENSTSGTGQMRLQQNGTGDAGFVMTVDGTNWFVGSDNSNSNGFGIQADTSLNSGAPFWITTGGNVGIGTTSPNYTLDVAGDFLASGGGSGSIVINDEDSTLCPTMKFTRNGGGTSTNDFVKFINSGGEVGAVNSIGGAYFLGDVGIGTAAPDYELDVNGTAYATNFRGPDGGYTIGGDADNLGAALQFYPTAGQIRGYINGSQVLTQTSTGLGLGTTSPAHELEVANASSPTIRINDTGGTSTAVAAWIEGAYAGTQAWLVGMNTLSAGMTITNYLNGPLTFGTNGIERLRVDANTGGTGGTGSAGSGNQYVELEISGSRYKLLHDGTL